MEKQRIVKLMEKRCPPSQRRE